MLLLLAAIAHASCPDIPPQVEAAWAAFNDAELETAKTVLEGANASLGCQSAVVTRDDLLSIYRLDALVSLTQEDQRGAVYATLRAVAADHENGGPPPEYGPELAELYETWASRLGESTIHITAAGSGAVWIDGRAVDADTGLRVVEGEHVVQEVVDGAVTSEVLELSADFVVGTPAAPVEAAPEPEPVPEPQPAALPEPVVATEAPSSRGRRRPAALWISGLASAAAGGTSLFLADRTESRFIANPYNAGAYGECTVHQTCYEVERQARIQSDATGVRVMYAGGYGLTAAGVALLGTATIGLPSRTALNLNLRW